MRESEKLQIGIERTQKEWEGLSLEEKKDKVIEYLQNKFDNSSVDDGKYNYSRLIMWIDICPDKEARTLVEEVHSSIMNHALQLKKEALEKEGDSNR